jgi:ATP-dependent Clp protease ATP-binding subunit ClpX
MSTFELLTKIEPEDLLTYGIIPELIGRLPIVCPLGELDEEALMKILTEPRNALVKQYIRLLEMENVKLHFEPQALKAIVQEVKKKRTGARALRSVMERVMNDIMFDIPSQKNVKEVIINKGVVTGKKQPKVVYLEKKKSA